MAAVPLMLITVLLLVVHAVVLGFTAAVLLQQADPVSSSSRIRGDCVLHCAVRASAGAFQKMAGNACQFNRSTQLRHSLTEYEWQENQFLPLPFCKQRLVFLRQENDIYWQPYHLLR